MGKSFQDWLKEGEDLYNGAMSEYKALEQQLAELQEKLAAKKMEVNQIAHVIGQSPIETPAVAKDESAVEVVEHGHAAPYTRNTIARALTGQPIRR